jgi:alanine racemase
MKDNHLTWLEIDSTAFGKNIKTVRKLAGGRQIAAAIKANGYGHGLWEMIQLLNNEKVEYIALHSPEEAVAARRFGWERKILMVGYINRSKLTTVIEHNLEPTIYNIDTINRLGKLAKKYSRKINIHLKLETGTGRQGVSERDLSKVVEPILKYPNLCLKGVSTHFANIEDTTDHTYANYQLQRFNDMVSQIKKLGLKPDYRHTACSAALLLFEDTKFELVRPGIALYGLWPSRETYLSYKLLHGTSRSGEVNDILSPILSWKTRVIQIKDMPPDSFVGYGCTYRTTSNSRLAVLPVGYYDGYDRALSNRAYVLIRGRRAPVRGRVCMNLMIVDITDIQNVRLEDEAVLIGRDGDETISVDQLADWAGSINYEIISRINSNIIRQIR